MLLLISTPCFESVRVSANLALNPASLTTSHRGSTLAAIYLISGVSKGGELVECLSNVMLRLTRVKYGEMIFQHTGFFTSGLPFMGRTYQLPGILPAKLTWYEKEDATISVLRIEM